MNDNHRNIIQANIEKLTQLTDYETMMKACVEKEVITDVMAEIIEQDGKSNELYKSELLFRKLIHRGPTAFMKILEIFKENNFNEAYKLLTASPVPSSTFSNVEVVLEEASNFLCISKTKDHNRTANLSPKLIQNENNINNNGANDESDFQLKTNNDGARLSINESVKLKPYTEKTSFLIEPEIQVKRAEKYGSHHKLQVYNMKSPRRGVFFFVNIIRFQGDKKNRNGAEKDRENLVTLFKEMYYTVFYYEDLTREQFFNLVADLKKSNYLKSIDSFVFCLQTHGDLHKNQTICEFSDGKTISVDVIIETFSNVNCNVLIDKPKVFFFPFCRGTISDKERKVSALIETDGVVPLAVPSYSDIMICYGTVPGFVTHRDTGFGSWYVRELCKVFAEHACDCHIEELLKMVGSKTLEIRDEGRLQVASTETRGFNKLLFFNPLIKEE